MPINLRRNPLWEKAEHESERTKRAQWESNQGRRVEQVWTEGKPTEEVHYETVTSQELRPVEYYAQNLKEDVQPVNLSSRSRNHLWELAEHESKYADQEANWVNIFPTGE